MLLQDLYVPFSINGDFTDVQVTHTMGTNHKTITDAGFYTSL